MKRKLKVQVWVLWKSESKLEVLLLKTKPGRGGFWQPVTGSVDSGEEVRPAAIREVKEETGLQIKEELLSVEGSAGVFEYESRGEKIQEFGFLALMESQEKPKIQLDGQEHDDFQWTSVLDAQQKAKFPSNVRVLNAGLKQIGLIE